MPLSPKPDSMMAMPGADQEQDIFEQSFSEMAQTMLTNKFPELAQSVVTFKIIDSDINTGSAVGAFIMQRPTGLMYVPIVLTDNQVKPIEIMYIKDADTFVPLTDEWLDQVQRGDIAALGQSVKTPESLYTDVDIRNLIVPPTTGRYSYASANDLKLPEFLGRADNKTRAKLAQLLESDRGLMKVAVAIYGSKTLVEALRPREEKVAEAAEKATSEKGLVYVTNKSNKGEFSQIFGKTAPAAMRGVAVKGYYAEDGRKNLKRPVDEESKVTLAEVGTSGPYKLFKRNGDIVPAFVFVRPHLTHSSFNADKYTGPAKVDHHNVKYVKYLVLTSDGYAELYDPPCGEPLVDVSELKGAAAAVLDGKESAPKQGKGVFVRARGNNNPEATVPCTIDSITTGKDGVKRMKAQVGYRDLTLIVDSKHPHGRIMAPKGDNVAVIPDDYKFVSVGERLWEDEFIRDPKHVSSAYLSKLREAGAVPLQVKKQASDGYYYIPGTPFWGEKPETVYVLAKAAHISVPDAEEIVKVADERGAARMLICSTAQLQKLAEGDDKKKDDKKSSGGSSAPKPPQRTTTVKEPIGAPGGAPPAGGAPGQDPSMAGQDPSMAGQDPSMAGAAPQPPQAMQPTLTDMAVQELQEEVARAHEEQMKLLQHKLDALQMVSQRTQELAQGVPREQSQAIQQAVQTAGGTPGAAPAAGGAPAGGSPAAVPPPEAPPDPSMMQQAAGLADPSMFDAAAIGTLAEHNSLKDLVSSYIPVLEKGLDHLGRILLTMWIKGSELREQMGEDNYTSLEDRLRNVFRGMGDVVLKLNQGSQVIHEGQDPTDHMLG